MDYPKRPPFFANKFIRSLSKCCAAQEIGAEACWLLSVIVLTEDARGYRSPVTYFNEQLVPICGFANVKALDRARSKAIGGGWLRYQQGGKHVPGRYFVMVPDTQNGWDDGPTDEGLHPACLVEIDQVSAREAPEKRQRSGEVTGREAGGKRQESGQPSSCTSPKPIPNQEENIPDELNTQKFREAWGEWKQHRSEIKKKLTPTSSRQQLAKLAKMGERRAIDALRHSIAGGWQGIFEPDGNKNDPPKQREQLMTDEEIAEFARKAREAAQ